MRGDKVSVPAIALPIVSALLALGLLAAGPVTNKPNPVRGKQLAERAMRQLPSCGQRTAATGKCRRAELS